MLLHGVEVREDATRLHSHEYECRKAQPLPKYHILHQLGRRRIVPLRSTTKMELCGARVGNIFHLNFH